MTRKRIVTGILVCFMVISTLTGCQNSSSQISNTPFETGKAPDLETDTSSEMLKMTMSAFQNAIEQGKTALLAAKNLVDEKPAYEGSEYTSDTDNEFIIGVPFERVDKSNVADYN